MKRIYPSKYISNHPRYKKSIPVHILVAERALGKPIPNKAEIHHFPHITNFSHLVICRDRAYHGLLKIRYRALKECGHPAWHKCLFCKEYSDPLAIDFHVYKKGSGYHRMCFRNYQRDRRAA